MQKLHLLSEYLWLETIFWLICLLAVAFVVNCPVRHLLLRGSYKLLSLVDLGQDTKMRTAIRYLANVAPVVIFSFGLDLIPGIQPVVATVVQNIAKAFVILAFAFILSTLLDFIETLYRHRTRVKFRPVKGLIQIAKIILFSVAVILTLATLIDRSPLIFLSGLGAMAAVLLLVFQDTLLSLVAGIQIASTDMIRVGDWIEVPKLGADGDVIDIALHTVTVQNFDKTITAIPIRKFVTDSFKNWRGMQETGGRRIKRSFYIDQTSIGFLEETDIKRLSCYRQLKTYIKNKQEEIEEWNQKIRADNSIIANTRKMTNIGTFRAYVAAYIKNHSGVRQDMTILVRQLAPGAEGLPLEIYCFTNTVTWKMYEAIQSDIFDHLYSIMPDFGLRVFQRPSGSDMQLMLSNVQNRR
ncbi:MAG: miniconductance mechanosensitive channel [Candidatus Tokpelaia sp. JSC085]|nr:MAG: miniconductance mechanosensitive channel [Candidatus Tokpelaia sp. JSC085]